MMKIGIIGSGAMASLFAARLSPLASVFMIGSWERQIRTVQKKGLTLIYRTGIETVHPVNATSNSREVRGVDSALVLVKTWQTRQAAMTASKILKPGGLALTLQNGIGNLEKIAAEVGEGRAILGSTSEGATMVSPGVVRHAGRGFTHIASGHRKEPAISDLAKILTEAGFETDVVSDAASLIWGKLAINAGINPLTGLLQVTNGFLAEDPVARSIMVRAADETAEVARVQGIELPYENAGEHTMEVARMTSDNRSSMAQDVARGTPTEIESITGAIVTIGQENMVPIPVNVALLTLIRAHLKEGNWRSSVGQLPADLRADFEYLANAGSLNEFTPGN